MEGLAEKPAAIPRGRRILVVDDESWIVDLVAEILAVDGHTVETAANGLVALRKIQERPYDLIVCDVRMPELDGPSLYRELAYRQPDLLPRIVFITGTTHETTTAAFLEQTGAPCLQKPFTIEDLRQVVRRMGPSE
jgi:CheY-like chemotaxis protein